MILRMTHRNLLLKELGNPFLSFHNVNLKKFYVRWVYKRKSVLLGMIFSTKNSNQNKKMCVPDEKRYVHDIFMTKVIITGIMKLLAKEWEASLSFHGECWKKIPLCKESVMNK